MHVVYVQIRCSSKWTMSTCVTSWINNPQIGHWKSFLNKTQCIYVVLLKGSLWLTNLPPAMPLPIKSPDLCGTPLSSHTPDWPSVQSWSVAGLRTPDLDLVHWLWNHMLDGTQCVECGTSCWLWGSVLGWPWHMASESCIGSDLPCGSRASAEPQTWCTRLDCRFHPMCRAGSGLGSAPWQLPFIES